MLSLPKSFMKMAEEAESSRRNIIIVPTGLECCSTPLVIEEEDFIIIQNILRFYRKHDSLVEDLRPDDDPNGPINNGYQKFRFNAGGRGYIRIKEDDGDRRIREFKWSPGENTPWSYKWPSFKLGLTCLELLKLDCRALTPFPSFIQDLKNLRELSLTLPWNLSHFPLDLGKFPHLKVLKLESSKIDELPQSIGLLSNLEELELSSMRRLRSLPSETQRLHKLKALRLCNFHCPFSLPEGLLAQLTDLETFSADGFVAADVLKDIGDINCLKVLSLERTRFDFLPDTIGRMTTLETLNLRDASLSSLPNCIGNLHNLRSIDLRGCYKVKSLPDSIGYLVNLKLLALSDTNVSSLPNSIGALENLKHLYLSRCKISSLPFSVKNLIELRTLDLSGSEIEYLPDSIGNLVNLKDLNICRTRKLSTLPAEFKNLAGLEILILSDSGVSFQLMSTVITNLKNLRVMIFPKGILGDEPSPAEDSLLEILEACPMLGCIGQHLGRFGCCPCRNAACLFESDYIPKAWPSSHFVCHKHRPHSHKTVMFSLVRNKIRSQIFYPSNSRTMSYPPPSLWPLIIERVENAAKFEYYCNHDELSRIDGERGSNCLPQADEIFQLLVDHGEIILSHATRRTPRITLGRYEEMERLNSRPHRLRGGRVSAAALSFLQRTRRSKKLFRRRPTSISR